MSTTAAPATTPAPAAIAQRTTTPTTGTTSGPLVALGLSLLAAGAVLALLSRRRFSTS